MEYLTDFFRENLLAYSLWLFVTYGATFAAMGVDLITGLRKSAKRGVGCNSRGLKRTCDKAMKYFLPMMCLTCIDTIAAAILPFPALTMLFGAYCIFCELKSVLETTYQKEEISRGAGIIEELLANPKLRDVFARLLDELRQ